MKYLFSKVSYIFTEVYYKSKKFKIQNKAGCENV